MGGASTTRSSPSCSSLPVQTSWGSRSGLRGYLSCLGCATSGDSSSPESAVGLLTRLSSCLMTSTGTGPVGSFLRGGMAARSFAGELEGFSVERSDGGCQVGAERLRVAQLGVSPPAEPGVAVDRWNPQVPGSLRLLPGGRFLLERSRHLDDQRPHRVVVLARLEPDQEVRD